MDMLMDTSTSKRKCNINVIFLFLIPFSIYSFAFLEAGSNMMDSTIPFFEGGAYIEGTNDNNYPIFREYCNDTTQCAQSICIGSNYPRVTSLSVFMPPEDTKCLNNCETIMNNIDPELISLFWKMFYVYMALFFLSFIPFTVNNRELPRYVILLYCLFACVIRIAVIICTITYMFLTQGSCKYPKIYSLCSFVLLVIIEYTHHVSMTIKYFSIKRKQYQTLSLN